MWNCNQLLKINQLLKKFENLINYFKKFLVIQNNIWLAKISTPGHNQDGVALLLSGPPSHN